MAYEIYVDAWFLQTITQITFIHITVRYTSKRATE
jgi:hypothetical protein